MALISLGKINKYIIFAFLGGIAKSIAGTLLYIYKNKLKKYPFMLGLNAGLGMTFSLIPELCLKIKNKGKNNINSSLVDKQLAINNEYYENYDKGKLRLKKFYIILLSAFLDCFQKVLVFLFSYSIDNNVWIFNIIFLSIFSMCILKTKLYKHQIYSSLIMVILGIFLNILILKDMQANKIPALLLSIFIEIIYSLCIVVNKYGMEFCFCSPYEMSFYEGLFELIFNVIFLSIATNVEINKESKILEIVKNSKYGEKIYIDNFFAYLNDFEGKEILMFIITMLSRWIFNLFSLIVVKYYTSSHVILLLILGEVQNAFFDIDGFYIQIIAVVIYIFLLFLLFVFTEIIILNFWGLDVNTKDRIAERALLAGVEENLVSDDRSNRDSNSNIEVDEGIEFNISRKSSK